MKRSTFARGLAIGVATALTLAVPGSSVVAQDDAEPVTITFITADPESQYAPLIEAFEAENPDITVTYQNVPFDQYNNVIQQRIGSKDPGIDVYLADSGAVGALAERGLLVDLSEFADQVRATAVPAAIEGNFYEGKMWALPMYTSLQYLYYNKALLDAAGVAYPSQTDRMTWEQVTEDAKAAQTAGAKWGILFDQLDRYYQLQALPESAGGGSGAAGDDLLTADVTNDGWVRAMDWYGSLFEDGLAPRGVSTDQMSLLFAAGQSPYFIGGPWSLINILDEETPIDFGLAPHPMFDGGTPAMPTGSWNIAISPATDDLEASKKFIEFTSIDVVGNALAAQEVIVPPTNIESFDNYIAKMDEWHPPNTDGMGALTLAELKTSAVNRPNSPGFTQLQDVLGRAFSDIRNGEDVEGTLQAAQDELQRLWDRLE